jgi:hypothetical protein
MIVAWAPWPRRPRYQISHAVQRQCCFATTVHSQDRYGVTSTQGRHAGGLSARPSNSGRKAAARKWPETAGLTLALADKAVGVSRGLSSAPRADQGSGGKCRNPCHSRMAEWPVCSSQAAPRKRPFGWSEAFAPLTPRASSVRVAVYWLSTLPDDISFHRLVDHAKH